MGVTESSVKLDEEDASLDTNVVAFKKVVKRVIEEFSRKKAEQFGFGCQIRGRHVASCFPAVEGFMAAMKPGKQDATDTSQQAQTDACLICLDLSGCRHGWR
ncbi:hypothetical protein MPTK1_5g18460 [Marchantia polymorpha subsp. ruderalis]|uniref:Uncharacterized protein n=2 Tax=Marchantia polymorpha TaxID=3197 RepID=A0AAF6BJR1_MARPO|nr:hypothetical protein MARPO_0073s0094 [Marchantia polymorpha]BBN12245.1 hypothetical protein Mp_5g18460 [Marchantia polymorpha subsp. ruderalis]|eukprot:PTQ35230.1 hypothetical protein MARPO_0073s0094 [Marchantia polymorpha]